MEYIFNLQETQMQKTQKKRSLMMKQGKWWNGHQFPQGVDLIVMRSRIVVIL